MTQTRAYPDPAYIVDFPNQSLMDELIKRRRKVSVFLFVSGLTAAVIFAITGWSPLGFSSLPLLFLGGYIWMRSVPLIRCTACDQRMRREYLSFGTETEEFLVCQHCRRYIGIRRVSI